MTQSFFITGRLPSLNDVINSNRRSKYLGAELKKNAEQLIAVGIRNARLKPVKSPVWIRYAWKEPNRKRDWDNVVSARKFIQDALVRSGILPGDGQRNIVGFEDRFEVCRDRSGCLVEIEEV
jgi:Holliday junction resolvase RusA-like endonuclease